jgi:hypothetical protein
MLLLLLFPLLPLGTLLHALRMLALPGALLTLNILTDLASLGALVAGKHTIALDLLGEAKTARPA